jgi:hypothetical protein
MNGGRESRRPRPALGCSAIDDDDSIDIPRNYDQNGINHGFL